jgi:ParB family chromosome partitioning protein
MARFENLDIESINVEKGIRQIIDREPLDELVASIRQHGILQPIVVESGGEEGRYKLHIGSRRMAAARIIGLEKVPALVLDGQLEAEKAITIMLVENLHREDLDPIDEAEAYATLKDMGTKVSAIARLVGKERTYVSHSLRLLRLHPRVREAVRQRTIPREHALALLRLEPEQQLALAEEVMEKGLTMQETRDKVRAILGKELKWRLVPIRIEPAVYDRLAQIAPDGDVAELLKQAVEKLTSEMNPRKIESFT